jgi:hypothetical protein
MARTARRPAVRRKRSAALPAKERPPGLSIVTSTRTIPLNPPAGVPATALQRAAMEWSYIVRNRRRWSAQASLVAAQAERAQALLANELGASAGDLADIARSRVAQVVVPYRDEPTDWEARVLPWEFVISAATRAARSGEPLTILRQLQSRSSPARPETRAPKTVLYVQSAPGDLEQKYSFESERALVQSIVSSAAIRWHEIANPTRAELRATVVRLRPDIVHLAGFDTHQGRRLLRDNRRPGDPTESEDEPVHDGYLIAGQSESLDAVEPETLASCVCAAARKPLLVSCSLWNSASRMAPMLIARGASFAISFQDSFDDKLGEVLFAEFYARWRRSGWSVRDGFLGTWEVLRQRAQGLTGTGVVLWSDARLVAAAPERQARQALERSLTRQRSTGARERRQVLSPDRDRVEDVVKLLKVTPFDELNYSLLHNNRPLFQDFRLVQGKPGRMTDLAVTVDLNVGAASFPFRRACDETASGFDLAHEIHVPLTADLVGSIHETVNTSLFVEVLWHDTVLYRNTHRVRLLSPDQWRDTDADRVWLPSFVLPRDPAVGKLIAQAGRYVRVLRDDPAAGFDGYQSIDPGRDDPTEDVDLQVQAIWSTLVHEWQLGYINPPPTYSKGKDSQRLRTPSAILRERCGTCIDLTLLFAACLELVDIYPVVFLLKGHAFPGYWRTDVAHSQFLEVRAPLTTAVSGRDTQAPGTSSESWVSGQLAYDEILRQVDGGALVAIESVMLTGNSGFWPAVGAGRENLRARNEFEAMVDVLSARTDRNPVTPLPIREVL